MVAHATKIKIFSHIVIIIKKKFAKTYKNKHIKIKCAINIRKKNK